MLAAHKIGQRAEVFRHPPGSVRLELTTRDELGRYQPHTTPRARTTAVFELNCIATIGRAHVPQLCLAGRAELVIFARYGIVLIMATKIAIEYFDDLDGHPIDAHDVVSVEWSWQGTDYEFDTTTAHLNKIENGRVPMATVLSKSRRVGRHTPRSAPPAPTAGSRGEVSRREIRAWARAHGYEIGDRGRVAADIVKAHHQSVG